MTDLLKSHPGVKAYDEIFNPEIPEYSDMDPFDALKMVYETHPDKMNGFKLLYHQALTNQGPQFKWNVVWQHMYDQKDIGVIHLVRDNHLARITSWKVAEETKVWIQYTEREHSIRVKLDPKMCEEVWTYACDQEEAFDIKFSDHPFLKVHYKDLAQDIPGTMDKVQRFLEVEPRTLTSRIKKRKGNWYDRLENYDELEEHFRGTRWEKFFTKGNQAVVVE